MPHYNTPRDESHALLAQLKIPEPREQAIAELLHAARAEPPAMPAWRQSLRHAKAWFFVPKVRLAVMAAIVAAFMLIGALNDPSTEPLPPQHGERQTAIRQPAAPAARMADEWLLYGLEQDEPDPLAALWLGDMAG